MQQRRRWIGKSRGRCQSNFILCSLINFLCKHTMRSRIHSFISRYCFVGRTAFTVREIAWQSIVHHRETGCWLWRDFGFARAFARKMHLFNCSFVLASTRKSMIASRRGAQAHLPSSLTKLFNFRMCSNPMLGRVRVCRRPQADRKRKGRSSASVAN